MSSKVSILHVYKDYYPPVIGGIEKNINQLAAGCSEEYDVSVLVANTRFKTEIETLDRIRIIKAASLGRFASAPICPTFPKLLKKYAADILHFHCPNPTGDLSYLWAKAPGKVVVSYHSDIVRQKWAMFLYGKYLMKFLERANVILPTSPNYIPTSPYLSKIESKCKALPLGIETERFRETPEIKLHAAELKKIAQGRPIILFVGRLRYYKGLHFLIQAMPRIDAHLIIVGTGPEEKNLRKQAEMFKVSEKITMAGTVSDEKLVEYYHAADVFCLPSHLRSEAYGLVQLEAMASGLPVVSCDIKTGVAYINMDGETGIIVDPASPSKLAEALNRILSDEELRKRLGEKARERVFAEFDVSHMINSLKKIYTRVLKKN
jgi:glycosyltransferase involved in cell wall biosynthesis